MYYHHHHLKTCFLLAIKEWMIGEFGLPLMKPEPAPSLVISLPKLLHYQSLITSNCDK